MSAEKATILRMVCKYFYQDRFALQSGAKIMLLPKISREALLGTNSPAFVTQLPAVKLSEGRLLTLRKRCYQYDDEYEFFKYALQCGLPFKKPMEWFMLGETGCRSLLDWVRTLPPSFLQSRMPLMAGLIVRRDAQLIREMEDHLDIKWDVKTMNAIYENLGSNPDGFIKREMFVLAIYESLVNQNPPNIKLNPAFLVDVVWKLILLADVRDCVRPQDTLKPNDAEIVEKCIHQFVEQEELGEVDDDMLQEIFRQYNSSNRLSASHHSFSPVVSLLLRNRVDLARLLFPFAFRCMPSIQTWLFVTLAAPVDCSQLIADIHDTWASMTHDERKAEPMTITDHLIRVMHTSWFLGRPIAQQNRVHYSQFKDFPAIRAV